MPLGLMSPRRRKDARHPTAPPTNGVPTAKSTRSARPPQRSLSNLPDRKTELKHVHHTARQAGTAAFSNFVAMLGVAGAADGRSQRADTDPASPRRGSILTHLRTEVIDDWRVKLHEVLDSNRFEFLISLLIVVNAVMLGVSTDARAHSITDMSFLTAFELFCLVIYSLELAARIVDGGLRIFRDSFWCKLDLLIVVTGWVDVVLTLAAASLSLPNTTILRVLRLFRLARAVRMIGQFQLLWMMARGLVSALQTLIWAFILFAVICYMFSIAAVQLIGDADEFSIPPPDSDEFTSNSASTTANSTNDAELYWQLGGDGEFRIYRDDDISQLVERQFSSVARAMLTCLQLSTYDAWSSIVRPVIERLPASGFLFLALMMVTALALMNLITAVLVERSIEGAKEDQEFARLLEEERLGLQMRSINNKLKAMDVNGDGMIDMGEVEDAWREPEPPDFEATASVPLPPGPSTGPSGALRASGHLQSATTSAKMVQNNGQPKDSAPGRKTGERTPLNGANHPGAAREPAHKAAPAELEPVASAHSNGPPQGAIAGGPSSGKIGNGTLTVPPSAPSASALMPPSTALGKHPSASMAFTGTARFERRASARAQLMKDYEERVELNRELKEVLGTLDEFKTIFSLTDTKQNGEVAIDALTQAIMVYKSDQNKFLLFNMLSRLNALLDNTRATHHNNGGQQRSRAPSPEVAADAPLLPAARHDARAQHNNNTTNNNPQYAQLEARMARMESTLGQLMEKVDVILESFCADI